MFRSTLSLLLAIVLAAQSGALLASTRSSRHAKHKPATPAEAPILTTQQVAARISPSIVTITIMGADGKPEALGSGIVIDDNTIATNLHVIRDAATATVTFANGTTTPVKAIDNWSTDKDIAILDVDTSGVSAVPESGDEPKVGDPVVAIGNPQGLQGSVSEGIVSGYRDIGDGVRVIQTTAPISEGSSGGALLDHHGNLVGMTSFQMVEGQNLNFAYLDVDIELVEAMQHEFTFKDLQGHWDLLTGDRADSDTHNTAARPDNLNDIFAKMKNVDKPIYQCGPVYVYVDQGDGTKSLSRGDLIDHISEKLKADGVLVCTKAVFDKDLNAVLLDVTSTAVKNDDGTWSCRSDMSIIEGAIVMRGKPIRAMVTTWSTDNTQYADTVSEGIYGALDANIASFAADYKQAPDAE